MPITPSYNNSDLGIYLSHRGDFTTGDIISGIVTRNSPFVAAEAIISVQLVGRVKTLVVKSNGQTSTTYRGRLTLFNTSDLNIIVHCGPIHIPVGGEGQQWPFSIRIPTYPIDPAIEPERRQDGIISIEQVRQRALPPSFCFDRRKAFIEYYLEATLQATHKPSYSATQPIQIYSSASPIPLTDFDIKPSEGKMHQVISQRLVPGMEHTELSFRQRTNKFFHSSKVPYYSFMVEVQAGSLIQLQNPNFFPFQVTAKPHWAGTSNSIVDVPQTISIDAFELNLESTVGYLTPRTRIQKKTTNYCLKSFHAPLVHADVTFASSGPSSSPLPSDSGKQPEKVASDLGITGAQPPPYNGQLALLVDNKAHPLDLGHLLSIRTDRVQATQLKPTFKTFNICHEARLKWTLSLSVAGETIISKGSCNVSILGPSEEQLSSEPIVV